MIQNSLFNDLSLIINWWAVLFLIGAAAYPLCRRLFYGWWDQGYLLSKALGLVLIPWVAWQFGSYKLLPFNSVTIAVSLIVVFLVGLTTSFHFQKRIKINWSTILMLEVFFFLALIFWSYIKAHEPDIRSLEKFMDYGFSAAIQQSAYFPPPDMWYAGGTINYYYFGHLVQALLSTLSGVHLSYGYNLMLATLFALCFTMSFGIAVQLYVIWLREQSPSLKRISFRQQLIALFCGIVSAFLVTLAGNMQTIYAFTQGYSGEDPPPVWTVLWSPQEFLMRMPEGINKYWYANATRFIPFTIHEFPSYSFVVSDNHGHVFNIPFVLLMIAALVTFFALRKHPVLQQSKTTFQFIKEQARVYLPYALFGGLIGVLLMTNALDGPVYLGLFGLFVLFQHSTESRFSFAWIWEKGKKYAAAGAGFIIASLPFLLNFKSFASGLAINCPPSFLQNTTIGPIIFETVDKCQRSPLWMMWLLWGFFWFMGIVLIMQSIRLKGKNIFNNLKLTIPTFHYPNITTILIVFFVYSVFLIFFAEFFYFKDIYPAHFRSNTMFKFGYQAFIMSSLLAGFVIAKTLFTALKKWEGRMLRLIFILLLIPQLFLVSIFPVFAVRSYFGNLEQYKGLYGLNWLQKDYPDDYAAFRWLETETKNRRSADVRQESWLRFLSLTDQHVKDTFFTHHIASIPVILEADGDSYTDFNRISAFTGLPTIIGWGVHEWLWRGTYDVVAPRKDEVRELYETGDMMRIRQLIAKYNIQYIIVGTLERQKFTTFQEDRFDFAGQVVFQSGNTKIYRIDK